MNSHISKSLIFLIAVALSLTGQPRVALPLAVDSARPLADLKLSLQARFGTAVTYEDPLWSWEGDTTPVGNRGERTPKNLRFVIPGEADSASSLSDVAERALNAYNRESAGPRYRLLSSVLGLHLIPSETRDEAGNFMPAKNILDAPITVAREVRRPSGHVAALQAAITAATGISLRYGMKEGDAPFDTYFAAEGAQLHWGADGTSARQALIDLLTRSATTYTWELRCQGAAQPANRFCVLSLGGIEVSTVDDSGTVQTKTLQFDRCIRCPPLANGR